MQRKKNQLTTRIATALVASLVAVGVSAQMPSKRPTLVVGIVVEGLTLDNLNLLRGYFSPDGFNRLMNNGVTITDLDFGSALDTDAATALIYTGASPRVNGIAESTVYDRASRRSMSVFNDPQTIGNYTDRTLSPSALRSSTLGDEIRIATGGLGHVYSIATRPGQALIMTGHSGNSGFWLDDVTGKWATSTYYKDVPTAIQSYNHQRPLDVSLDTMVWNSVLPAEKYPDMPSYKKLFSFRHVFQRTDPDRFRQFAASPLANREVTSIAADYIKSMRLGKGENFDMLNIAYTVSPYSYGKDGDTRMEVMDSYIRLDSDLRNLFSKIDTDGPGMNNTLVFLAGTPLTVNSRRDDEKWAPVNGEFSPRKAISLLNMYLIAVHGNGEWVLGYSNNKFYLNHNLIKDRDLELRKVRTEAADFINRMTGVAEAMSVDDIIDGRAAETAIVPRRNLDYDTAGDIYLSVIPGWEIVDDGTTTLSSRSYPVEQRFVAPVAPAFILAPEIPKQTINTSVDARALAPTVNSILRIRSPNGSQIPPLRFNSPVK